MEHIHNCPRNGYPNEPRVPYTMLDVATGLAQLWSQLKPNEAADLNHNLLGTNLRWVPAKS